MGQTRHTTEKSYDIPTAQVGYDEDESQVSEPGREGAEKNEIQKTEAERKILKGKQCTLRWKKQSGAIGRAKGETTHPGRKKAQEEHDKKYPNAEGGTEARSALQSLKNGGSIARRA